MLIAISTFIIGISILVWMPYEIWRAPMMDEFTGEIIEPTKKLSDLFKKKSDESKRTDK